MTPGTEAPRRRRFWIAAVAAGCSLVALPAAASAAEAGEGALSPRLTELASPAVGSAPAASQARKLSLAKSGPGSLLRSGDRLVAEVRFDAGAGNSLEALRRAGAEIVGLSRRYQTVTVAVEPSALTEVGEVAGVRGVTEDLAPLVSAAGPPTTSATAPCVGGIFGAATSEGDLQLNAMKARTEFGVDGSGVTVGLLSDTYNKDTSAATTAAEDVASGDLPGPGNPCDREIPVNVISDPSPAVDPEPTDEGRGMAQIVHDLAPGAALAFATAYPNEVTFAGNIAALANAGAKVIVDDISYFDEPFFQEGPVAVAVSEATAKGVTYFSAAGNNNLIAGGHDISSWEAPAFRDSSSCPAALAAIGELNASHCMDFDPTGAVDNTFGITVSPGATLTLDLQWAEPWHGVATDIDAFLLTAGGNLLEAGGNPVGSADDNINTTQQPVEIFQWENTAANAVPVQLAINRFSGGNPRLKFALLENGGGVSSTEYPTSSGGDVVGPTIFGHNGGTDTVSVGAIRYNTNSAPEGFSSRGPVTHYFGPVSGPLPAAPIAPDAIDKPDLVATDGGADTFFGSCVSGAWRFFGTSAAAPHAAAVAALGLDLKPTATVSEIKQAEVEKAGAIPGFGIDAVGSGLLDASAALGQLNGSSPGTGTAGGPGFPSPACPAAAKTPPAPSTPPPPPPPPPPSTPIAAAGHGPPSTSFAQRPNRTVRTHGHAAFVSFRFRSDQVGSFVCSIDGGQFRPCRRKLARWFPLGSHSVRVVARNADGEVDPTPAVFRFAVKRGG